MSNNLRHVMPYGSIHMRVPDFWQEDASNPEEGIVYFAPGALAGPFRIRREDFLLESGEDAAFGLGEFRGVAEDDHHQDFMQTFARLFDSFSGADIVDRELEPETEGGRMFCYVKRAVENGNSILLHGWVRGVVTSHKSFAVVSFSLAVPEAVAKDQEVRETIVALDHEVRRSEILTVDAAKQLVRDTLVEHFGLEGDAGTGGGRPGNGSA